MYLAVAMSLTLLLRGCFVQSIFMFEMDTRVLCCTYNAMLVIYCSRSFRSETSPEHCRTRHWGIFDSILFGNRATGTQ